MIIKLRFRRDHPSSGGHNFAMGRDSIMNLRGPKLEGQIVLKKYSGSFYQLRRPQNDLLKMHHFQNFKLELRGRWSRDGSQLMIKMTAVFHSIGWY